MGRVKNELFDERDDFLQTFIPKSNNQMHDENSAITL